MEKIAFTLAQLAEKTQSTLVGDPEYVIHGVEALEHASDNEISFLHNMRYEQAMRKSSAGAVVMNESFSQVSGKNYLINANPSQAFQTIVDLYNGGSAKLSGFEGIHSTAVIHPTAVVAKNVIIGPYAVVDENCSIGEGSFIGSGVYIGCSSSIGCYCIIHPKAVIRERCSIGNHVIIQPGAIIGSCGFGYAQNEIGEHIKLNHVGTVSIEDNVEIGANTTVDRARFKVTTIAKGSKIDNLVQIAHGVSIGRNCIIVSQTGIAGSTRLEDHVMLGGQVAINGHIILEKGVVVAAKSGVSKSLRPGVYGGIPVLPIQEYNRVGVMLRKIESFVQRLNALEKKIG